MAQYVNAIAVDKNNAYRAISLYRDFFLKEDTYAQKVVFQYVARSTKIDDNHRWLLGNYGSWKKGDLWDNYSITRIDDILTVSKEVMDDVMANLDRLNASVSEGYALINKVYRLEEI